MSIVEFVELPSWSLDASEAGESTKYLCEGWWRARQVKFFPPLHFDTINSTAYTHGHFVLSPVSLASTDHDSSPSILQSTLDQYLLSHVKIGDCEQSTFRIPFKFIIFLYWLCYNWLFSSTAVLRIIMITEDMNTFFRNLSLINEHD